MAGAAESFLACKSCSFHTALYWKAAAIHSLAGRADTILKIWIKGEITGKKLFARMIYLSSLFGCSLFISARIIKTGISFSEVTIGYVCINLFFSEHLHIIIGMKTTVCC